MKEFSKYHLPAVLYAALIIVLSSLPGLGLPSVKIIQLDKIIHFIEYAIFAVLIYRSFSHISDKIKDRLVIFLSMFFVALFAVFDEVYQSYVPGRQSDAFDLLFDFMGAFLIVVYLSLRGKYARRRSAEK